MFWGTDGHLYFRPLSEDVRLFLAVNAAKWHLYESVDVENRNNNFLPTCVSDFMHDQKALLE